MAHTGGPDHGCALLGCDSYYSSKMDNTHTPSVNFDLEDRPIVPPSPSRPPPPQGKSSSSSSPTPDTKNSPPRIQLHSRRCSTSHRHEQDPTTSLPTFWRNLTKCLPSPSIASSPTMPMTPKRHPSQTCPKSCKKTPSTSRTTDAYRRSTSPSPS